MDGEVLTQLGVGQILTQLGVGGILVIIVLREVLGFLRPILEKRAATSREENEDKPEEKPTKPAAGPAPVECLHNCNFDAMSREKLARIDEKLARLEEMRDQGRDSYKLLKDILDELRRRE